MDLLLETSAGWVIIDHKSFPGAATDWHSKAQIYTGQLAVYEEAMRANGQKVAGSWIHFAMGGGIVRIY